MMSQVIVGVSVQDVGSVPAFNIITGPTVAGIKSNDLLDLSGESTGYTLVLDGPFAGRIGSAGFATSSPDIRFPLEFFRAAWYVSLSSDHLATFTIGSLPEGEPYRIEVAACSTNVNPTTFSATGSSPEFVGYTAGPVDPVPQPVVLEGVVPAGGEVTLSGIGSSSFAYNNGFLLTVGEDAPTATATLSGDLQPGASFTVTYSDYDAIPVSPVTITDSNNNAITVAVTINDAVADGKHSGTATGTFPALPSSGTAQGLLFGNVTVELNT